MKQITRIFLASSAAIFMTACGGGGGSSSDDYSPPIDSTPPVSTPIEPPYRVSMNGSPYKITLTKDSYVIGSMHCVNTALYDTNGAVMYTYQEVPAGNYLFELTRKFTKIPEYDDSKGVFYSLSSNYELKQIQIGASYTVPTRTMDLYQLDVQETTSYVADTVESNIDIYDSNLELMSSHVAVFTLEPGTYYILTTNYSCSSPNGSFKISLY